MKTYTKHPCVTQNSDGTLSLNIIEGMFHENSLPKWQKPTTDSADSADKIVVSNQSALGSTDLRDVWESVSSTGRISRDSAWAYDRLMSESASGSRKNKESVFRRAAKRFRKTKSVDTVMEEAKSSLRHPLVTAEVRQAAVSAKAFLTVLEKSGQVYQANKVRDYLSVLTYELALVEAGYGKYLLDTDIIKFMLASEKGVYIDFLRNYKELMPLEVCKKKIAVDGLKVFDNYAVLFYSAEVNPFREIVNREQKRKTLDPILFGMIEGSRKLYYITDWTTDKDDLTLDRLEQVIGQTAPSLADYNVIGETTISDIMDNMETYANITGEGK